MQEVGTIKSVVTDRGFGFIKTSERKDIFFHAKDLDPGLAFGEGLISLAVRFTPSEAPDGRPRASKVEAV